MAFRFEELKVWQNALDLCNQADLLTKEFPRLEMFSLSSQLKRAVDSVVLNIAEGSTGAKCTGVQAVFEYSIKISH